MHYHAAVSYLYSFLNFETLPFEYRRQFNLQRMNRLLDWFHHPEYTFTPILVGGTNGKGSTATFLSSILSENNYLTGLYTSPHLSDPRERIRLNGRAISEGDFAELVTAMRYVVKPRKKELASIGPVTFFEVFTLLAVLYFARKRVQFGIFEVGMGGRLDATKAVGPKLCVLTPVGYDHVEHLGKTLGAIAGEKVAIVSRNGQLVCSRQPRDARRKIQEWLRKKKARGHFLGVSFQILRKRMATTGSRFDFQMDGVRLLNLKIRLPGKFQIENAATALAAAHILQRQEECHIEPEKIAKGLRRAFWPGRFEIVKRQGETVILDGAHNDASMREMCASLESLFPTRKKVVILGTSREKNLSHILKPLSSVADCFIVTKTKQPRAQEPKVILEALSDLKVRKPSFWSPNVAEAFKIAKRLGRRNAVKIVTGSLFLVGEAREFLKCPKFI
ncbi:MAG: hypothetical protein A3G87_01965 [Omnitrophica bacterium RIFCSPLOWO2_12_FULL_50_11]|nr:MAG: hypothetical protein A3G87_01965 [Omnitrophica bacterium RIFCSPLOWO2_12_FULL_50_11]